MARILFATVPLSGHVHPGLPVARELVRMGHELTWYCGVHFREKILSTGARFEPFRKAPEFYDELITSKFGKVPTTTLLAHSSFYIRKVFYDPMPAYYEDLSGILQHFDADVIVSDEWFTGGIPFSEKKIKPWVIYGNSPLMLISPDAPTPGAGLMPAGGAFGRNRDRIVNAIATALFIPIHRHINRIRHRVDLPDLQYFFAEQNIRFSALTLKFNTPIFEFPRKDLPEQIRFVGPVLPENDSKESFPWLEKIRQSTLPNLFITQGSVDIYNIRKLIIPSLKALQGQAMNILVSTGGKDPAPLKVLFPQENIIVEKYIPYSLVMPHLTLMITNGGYGGVSTALSFGVPVIIAGNSEDKPEIASRIKYCGAGIKMGTGTPSPAQIRRAVHRILHHPVYKARAMAVCEDFRRHDAVHESIQYILQVAAGTAGFRSLS